jgi:GT2 family glycosyltransferase
MKVLGYIHSYNDEEVIDSSVRALLEQSYHLDEVLLVDNASTDGTLRRAFPQRVTVIRHPENWGTSGAVSTGLRYALANNYDWIWLLDADSAPRRNALEQLFDRYRSFAPDLQQQTWLLASLPVNAFANVPRHASIFTEGGYREVQPLADQPFYECDATIWSGSLYNLSAVQRVGLPSEDYVLDVGENEYAYRGKRMGYRSFVDQLSIVEHNISGQSSMSMVHYRLGPWHFPLIAYPPIRLYYTTRNILYFWLHEYHHGSILQLLRLSPWVLRYLAKLLLFSRKRWPEVLACTRGTKDGLFKNMHHRY